MQACARIGATHSVVFGGFSADSITFAPFWIH
jgi:acyl-coenzyme A synthetase/AMP-(fatty) acid ligase